jgi:hypothetical protein
MHVRRIAWQFIFVAIFANAAFSGDRAATEFIHQLIPKYIVGMRLRCIGQHFQNGCVWITPIVSAFSGTRPPGVRGAAYSA